jgi:hypothetical protein
MKSFKGYLIEQIKKGYHSFLHPIKGMYKLSHDAQQNVYHLHNKFGDLAHTISGHLTPTEAAKELKDSHGMILVDKLHEDRLDELAKKPVMSDDQKEKHAAAKKVSSEINTHRGGYNETQLAKHLNDGKYIDKEHESLDKHHKSKLAAHDKKYGTNEVKTQEDRAHEQSRVFKEHSKKRGYEGVHEVHLVSKPGEIEKKTGIKASQQENPTDVAVKFHKKPTTAKHHYLGISAKSSKVSKIGFHNGGTKELSGFLSKHLGGHNE